MSDVFKSWLQNAHQIGWIDSEQLIKFKQFNQENRQLIESYQITKPIVVAMFGGTGVGKSSLVNALATADIAKTGVTRPTSDRIIIYLHESVNLAQLPPDLPQAQIIQHQDTELANIVLVDMPDIDSRISAHHEIAFAWLAYADVVLYVVSPERYRDSKGWIEIKNHGQNHAWIFVINQWDLAHEEQYVSLVEILQTSGFSQPVIFRTSTMQNSFELPQLKQKLIELSNQNLDLSIIPTIRKFSQQIKQLGTLEQTVATADIWREIIDNFNGFVDDLIVATGKALHKTCEIEATLVHQKNRPTWRWIFFKHRREISANACERYQAEAMHQITNSMAQPVFFDRLRWLCQQHKHQPLWHKLEWLPADFIVEFADKLKNILCPAVQLPGRVFTRILHRLFGWLRIALPTLVSIWVGWMTYTSYLNGIKGLADFAGINFVFHSLLIITLSWLIPALLYRVSTPSIYRSLLHVTTSLWRQHTKKLAKDLKQQEKIFLQEHEKCLTELHSIDRIFKQKAHKYNDLLHKSDLGNYVQS